MKRRWWGIALAVTALAVVPVRAEEPPGGIDERQGFMEKALYGLATVEGPGGRGLMTVIATEGVLLEDGAVSDAADAILLACIRHCALAEPETLSIEVGVAGGSLRATDDQWGEIALDWTNEGQYLAGAGLNAILRPPPCGEGSTDPTYEVALRWGARYGLTDDVNGARAATVTGVAGAYVVSTDPRHLQSAMTVRKMYGTTSMDWENTYCEG